MGNVLSDENKAHAFIIDDEEGICILLSALLEKLGLATEYNMQLAGAVQKAKKFEADLIFLDLNLKDGSGFSIIDELKENIPHAKIVIISAHTENKEKQRSKDMGVDLFLEKPLSTGVIKNTIEQLNI